MLFVGRGYLKARFEWAVSWIFQCGLPAVAVLIITQPQRALGGELNMPDHTQVIKYGVISAKRLCQDLREWDTFYVSGRLHKPVVTLKEDAEVAEAAQVNLASALSTSLLLLPSSFSLEARPEAHVYTLPAPRLVDH